MKYTNMSRLTFTHKQFTVNTFQIHNFKKIHGQSNSKIFFEVLLSCVSDFDSKKCVILAPTIELFWKSTSDTHDNKTSKKIMEFDCPWIFFEIVDLEGVDGELSVDES